MTRKTILYPALVAAAMAISMGANAADADKPQEPKVAASTPAEKATPAMKKHSHMEEKGGMAPKPAEPKVGQSNPAKDMSKHYHPRDGK
ncbi:hypothetical protein ACFONG_06675 [Uliginosibacterium paludis]|uniref:Pentapeptide MXKDX repeat protein n=1 Tax=Uliginosibacterium paludis TaxID=1615952 RepID=A0ABV2CLB6_9RHOO